MCEHECVFAYFMSYTHIHLTLLIPHHDIKELVIPGPDQCHATPGPKPVLQKDVGMELGQQTEHKLFVLFRNRRRVSVHV